MLFRLSQRLLKAPGLLLGLCLAGCSFSTAARLIGTIAKNQVNGEATDGAVLLARFGLSGEEGQVIALQTIALKGGVFLDAENKELGTEASGDVFKLVSPLVTFYAFSPTHPLGKTSFPVYLPLNFVETTGTFLSTVGLNPNAAKKEVETYLMVQMPLARAHTGLVLYYKSARKGLNIQATVQRMELPAPPDCPGSDTFVYYAGTTATGVEIQVTQGSEPHGNLECPGPTATLRVENDADPPEIVGHYVDYTFP